MLAAIGVGLYGLAAIGYLRLYRRRQTRFVFAFALAFVLLAEAMVVIAWARNWQLSWWEWHVLMLGAFVVIAVAARAEWHEERFSPLYLEGTLAAARDVSILFADLEGFTSYSERHAAADVASMLNAYFGRVVPLMERAGGEVHQIVGDELMVVFNLGDDTPDHPSRAARARPPPPAGGRRTSPATTTTGRRSASGSTAARCTRASSAPTRGTASTAWSEIP